MSANEQMLEVVDENDQVIGMDTRENIHNLGLLHREIHIYFFTPEKEIIFQHRAKDKDTYPDLLDATVGGHVDPGMSYLETAVKECKEETGITVTESDLNHFGFVKGLSVDELTGRKNNSLRAQYLYLYKGEVENLIIEKGKGIGFEKIQIDDFNKMTDEERKIFIPTMRKKSFIEMLNQAILKLNLE